MCGDVVHGTVKVWHVGECFHMQLATTMNSSKCVQNNYPEFCDSCKDVQGVLVESGNVYFIECLVVRRSNRLGGVFDFILRLGSLPTVRTLHSFHQTIDEFPSSVA